MFSGHVPWGFNRPDIRLNPYMPANAFIGAEEIRLPGQCSSAAGRLAVLIQRGKVNLPSAASSTRDAVR